MYIGTAAGNRPLKNPVVGTATGNRPINKVWVGTSGGNKLVWQRWTSTTTLTATVASTRQINLSWTASVGATYQLFRNGTAITGVTSSLSFSDTGLAEGTAYSYRVDVIFEGKVQGSATASATTGVTPPPTTVQRFWESRAAGSRSYNGSNTDREVAEMYYGYYSSNQGLQKSRFWFDIPADMRASGGCISIDRIDLAIWGQHTYPNGGNNLYLAIIHDSNNIGSTGGLNWTFNVPKGGWVGPHDGSGWCLGLQGLSSSGRYTMAEEFRVYGAVGFSLVATTTAQSGYGYCQGATQANYPRMRVWYSCRV